MPAPGARSYEENPVFAELTGKIGVPVMSLHETADFRVPFRLEQDYRRRAEEAGTSQLLVQRAVRQPGHCRIEDAVREPAFDDLGIRVCCNPSVVRTGRGTDMSAA